MLMPRARFSFCVHKDDGRNKTVAEAGTPRNGDAEEEEEEEEEEKETPKEGCYARGICHRIRYAIFRSPNLCASVARTIDMKKPNPPVRVVSLSRGPNIIFCSSLFYITEISLIIFKIHRKERSYIIHNIKVTNVRELRLFKRSINFETFCFLFFYHL